MTREPMTRHRMPQTALKAVLLLALPCTAGAAGKQSADSADSCMTLCGKMKFSQFMAEVRSCGGRESLGECKYHSEGHYTSRSPCQVTIDLRPLGSGTRVFAVEHTGDSRWSTTAELLTLHVNTGIVVTQLRLSRPRDQCVKPR